MELIDSSENLRIRYIQKYKNDAPPETIHGEETNPCSVVLQAELQCGYARVYVETVGVYEEVCCWRRQREEWLS